MTQELRTGWAKALLVVSWIPSALLVAYIAWYTLVFRPSGQEAWGDGATIFYLGAITYPLSLGLITLGVTIGCRSRRKYSAHQSIGPVWLLVSGALLVAPFAALYLATG